MGAVYLGEHAFIGKRVAVKILHAEFADDEQVIKRFIQEAQAAAAIRHKGIIDVMDVGVSYAGDPYLVMEYLEGESLAGLLEREKRLDLAAASAILEQVLLALTAAHEKGVVHRDLKPENIFLVHQQDDTPAIKLIDFGIAKFSRNEMQTRITRPEDVFGTPYYMSPEQMRGSGEVDNRSDLFSVGIIFYQMLAGERPFTADNRAELMLRIMTEEPRPPRQAYPDFPAQAEPLIMKALEKKPEYRFQSATEMLNVIRELTTYGERQQSLTHISTGLKRAIVGGDLGKKIRSGRRSSLAADVLSEMAEKSTPKVWSLAAAPAFRRYGWYAGLGGLALALAAVWFLLWKPAPAVQPTASPAARPAEPTKPLRISPSNRIEQTARPNEVQITVTGAPQGAALYYDGALVSINPFRVKRGDAVTPLRVEAAGYKPFSYALLPSEDRIIKVNLEPPAATGVSQLSTSSAVKPHPLSGAKPPPLKATGLPAAASEKSAAESQSNKAKLSKGGRGTVFGRDFE